MTEGWWQKTQGKKVYKCMDGHGHGADNSGCMLDWKATIKLRSRK